MLLPITYEEVWLRGESCIEKGSVRLREYSDTKADGLALGSKPYKVKLQFVAGKLMHLCDCPYVGGEVCKHMVALALLWDSSRLTGGPPSRREVEENAITPPLVSYANIQAQYKKPLTADLDVVRIAASESGSRSHAHTRFPNLPPLETKERIPVTKDEIEKAFREIVRWTKRKSYDRYYCAGEMAAAFCEIIRIVRLRGPITRAPELAQILVAAQKFEHRLIDELIDNKDGLEVFTSAHIDDLAAYVTRKSTALSGNEQSEVEKLLFIFDNERDER
jgi:hypothetical protein